jgi:hypothetical protein
MSKQELVSDRSDHALGKPNQESTRIARQYRIPNCNPLFHTDMNKHAPMPGEPLKRMSMLGDKT